MLYIESGIVSLLLLNNRGVFCAIDQIFSILRVAVGIHLILRAVVIFHIIRIITKTRKINVSEACCYPSDAKIYKMEPLSDDDSKMLL